MATVAIAQLWLRYCHLGLFVEIRTGLDIFWVNISPTFRPGSWRACRYAFKSYIFSHDMMYCTRRIAFSCPSLWGFHGDFKLLVPLPRPQGIWEWFVPFNWCRHAFYRMPHAHERMQRGFCLPPFLQHVPLGPEPVDWLSHRFPHTAA